MENFNYDTVEYNGETFKCRVIADLDSESEGELLIAPEELQRAITSRELGIEADAVILDESICYYASPEEMLMSDVDLFNLIYK